MLQDLRAHNFECDIQSVDRLTGEGKNKICEPYHYLKSTIYENRIEIYKTETLTEELIGLEKLSDGHIDHTTSGINSKDISDALCGAVFEASKHAEEFAFDYGETLDTVTKISNDTAGNLDAQQIAVDFEAEMQKLLNPMLVSNNTQNTNGPATRQNLTHTTIQTPSSLVFDDMIIW